MNLHVRRPSRPFAALLLVGLLGAPAVATEAQETRTECRCVDAEGRTIENCACFRTPSFRLFEAPRARIGVSLEEDVNGARVTDVLEDSPAEAAGIRVGDVIVRVNGQSLREPLANRARERSIDDAGDVAVQRLMALAQDWEVGTPVDLEVQRGTGTMNVRVEPERAPPQAVAFGPGGRVRVFGRGEFPVDSLLRSFRFDVDSLRPLVFRADSLARGAIFRFSDGCFEARGLAVFGGNCIDGVRMVELNPELGEYFGVSTGVLVSSVEEGSTLGLRPGDVILSIGGRTVDEPEQARRILASYDDDEDVPIRIRRRGQEMEVTGRRR